MNFFEKRKIRKQLKTVLHHARTLRCSREDIMNDGERAHLDEHIARAREAYAARDGEGYRRHPGGARVRIEIVGGAGEESTSGQAAAAAADYLRAVGIDAAYRQITSEEYWRLHLAHNTLEAAWIEIDAPLLPLVHPTAFLGRGLSEAGHLPWAGLYAHHGLVAEGDPAAQPPPGVSRRPEPAQRRSPRPALRPVECRTRGVAAPPGVSRL